MEFVCDDYGYNQSLYNLSDCIGDPYDVRISNNDCDEFMKLLYCYNTPKETSSMKIMTSSTIIFQEITITTELRNKTTGYYCLY